jgi:hypothetical protein
MALLCLKRSNAVAGLAKLISRTQPRSAEQRSEPRHSDFADRAVITFRGQEHLVPVLNISSRGTMIEANLVARIGEEVIVQFEHCSRIHAYVRWVREGRVGLNFGQEIVLG